MDLNIPKPGDLVLYAGRSLFFEPNGKRCYLYVDKSQIGKPEFAVFAPSVTSVKQQSTRRSTSLPLKPLPRSDGDIREQIRRIDEETKFWSPHQHSLTMLDYLEGDS